jgi:3-dehydroquinate dehydratase/shikimate dehydrogenase
MAASVSMSRKASLPNICIALGFPDTETLLKHAHREVESGETFIEFRWTICRSPWRACRRSSASWTAIRCNSARTCRRHQNHGKFNGSIEEQLHILDCAIDAGARAIDIEIESAELVHGPVEHLRGKAWLILSFHNFSGTPALEPVLKRMTKIPADAYKIVTTARKPSDNYRVLSLARSNPRTPLVMLAMGEPGLATRVLSPSQGAVYTYAAPNAAEGTAPGQISARLLRQLYRVDKFSKAAKIYGVIADPVRHSISPAVHNRSFQSRRIDAVYLPFSGQASAAQGFLRFRGQASDRRLQRHDSTQTEDHPLPRRGGPARPPASALSIRYGARPANGAAPIPTSRACWSR